MITISKNSVEELRVALREYKGHEYVDLRIYAEFDTSEKLPTKRGITVPPRLLADLISALQDIESDWRAANDDGETRDVKRLAANDR